MKTQDYQTIITITYANIKHIMINIHNTITASEL